MFVRAKGTADENPSVGSVLLAPALEVASAAFALTENPGNSCRFRFQPHNTLQHLRTSRSFAFLSFARFGFMAYNSPSHARPETDTFTAGNRTYTIAVTDEGVPQLKEGESRMSSLSRRACYKCGNVGHYAEVCSSSERLCYNCKQPGHESNSCPHPRTTESTLIHTLKNEGSSGMHANTRTTAKQCYHCQGLGHVQADCPTLRLSGATSGRCYSCGQPGHLARNCTSAGGAPPPAAGGFRGGRGGFRGGYGGGMPRAATCYKCGGPNHYARDCQAQSMKCYACGKLGHISRDCTAPNGGPLNTEGGKTCYRCGEVGHISKNCTQAETNGVAGAGTETAAAPAAAPAAAVA